jgi:hypothetical protein
LQLHCIHPHCCRIDRSNTTEVSPWLTMGSSSFHGQSTAAWMATASGEILRARESGGARPNIGEPDACMHGAIRPPH